MKYSESYPRKSFLSLGFLSLLAHNDCVQAVLTPIDLGALTVKQTIQINSQAPYKSFTDYGAGNLGWTHTAGFARFKLGDDADIASGNQFDIQIVMEGRQPRPMNFPAFSVWTSGINPDAMAGGASGSGYGHAWSPVRGSYDGGRSLYGAPVTENAMSSNDDPCDKTTIGDCSVGTNGWFSMPGSAGDGNIVKGHGGWIGFANSGYSYLSNDGDYIPGRLSGKTNILNEAKYQVWDQSNQNKLNGEFVPLTQVNVDSPYVKGGVAVLDDGSATLKLFGLKAGYYFIGLGGVCPDLDFNGQNCAKPPADGSPSRNFTLGLSVSPVSVTVLDRFYDGGNQAVVASCDIKKYSSDDDISCNAENAVATFSAADAGKGKLVTINGVTYYGSSVGKYVLPSTVFSVANISRAFQSDLFLSIFPDYLFKDNSAELVAVGGSGTGAVSYYVEPSDAQICRVEGTKLHALKPGICHVVARKEGDINYLESESQALSVKIQLDPNLRVDATCGSANNVKTSSRPSGDTLCSSYAGVLPQPKVLSDGRFNWLCSGQAGGSSAQCYSANDKANQNPLLPGVTDIRVSGGNKATIIATGGSGKGAIKFNVSASGGAKCRKTVSGKRLTIKTVKGNSGSCLVQVLKDRDKSYNSVNSAPISIMID